MSAVASGCGRWGPPEWSALHATSFTDLRWEEVEDVKDLEREEDFTLCCPMEDRTAARSAPAEDGVQAVTAADGTADR